MEQQLLWHGVRRIEAVPKARVQVQLVFQPRQFTHISKLKIIMDCLRIRQLSSKILMSLDQLAGLSIIRLPRLRRGIDFRQIPLRGVSGEDLFLPRIGGFFHPLCK